MKQTENVKKGKGRRQAVSAAEVWLNPFFV